MFNFTIDDRQIIVNDTYFGKDLLNEYFKYHKLKNENYTMEQIDELIDSVAYVLDNKAENSDYFIIEDMLEE
jgi:hypothetical protein